MSEFLNQRAVAPLSIATDLTITVHGVTADVESTGERLIVRFRSLADVVRALRGPPRTLGRRSLTC